VLKSVGDYAFYGCSKLASANLPNVEKVRNSGFRGCLNLASVKLSNATEFDSYAFQTCPQLKILDFEKVTRIGTTCFGGDFRLTTLILRSTTLCVLTGTNAFSSTPFASSGEGGTVYVPQALITEYQNATNWSILYASGKCNFVAIEGSEYE
jgi:hypothetical protein